MKVNNSTIKPGQLDSMKNRELDAKAKPEAKAEKVSSADIKSASKVAMSSEAQAMNKAKALASADTVDEAKVSRLQKLIDEGRYNTDASAIADRLVDEHLLLTE